MLLISSLIEDLKDVATRTQLRPFDLKELGFVLSDRKIIIGTNDESRASHVIYECLDQDTRRPVSFCFLFSRQAGMGIVLQHPFEHYVGIDQAEEKLKSAKTGKAQK